MESMMAGEWVCATCTLANAALHLVCDACNTAKVTDEGEPMTEDDAKECHPYADMETLYAIGLLPCEGKRKGEVEEFRFLCKRYYFAAKWDLACPWNTEVSTMVCKSASSQLFKRYRSGVKADEAMKWTVAFAATEVFYTSLHDNPTKSTREATPALAMFFDQSMLPPVPRHEWWLRLDPPALPAPGAPLVVAVAQGQVPAAVLPAPVAEVPPGPPDPPGPPAAVAQAADGPPALHDPTAPQLLMHTYDSSDDND